MTYALAFFNPPPQQPPIRYKLITQVRHHCKFPRYSLFLRTRVAKVIILISFDLNCWAIILRKVLEPVLQTPLPSVCLKSLGTLVSSFRLHTDAYSSAKYW